MKNIFIAGPVDVTVFIFVSSLRSISEQTMVKKVKKLFSKSNKISQDYKLELYFREYWQDPRLSYNPAKYANTTQLSLHESLITSLWTPDTFLPNAIDSVNPDTSSITHRSLIRLKPDGHVLLSRRLSVTAECPMDLTLYPFDQQVCRLSIESCKYCRNFVFDQICFSV